MNKEQKAEQAMKQLNAENQELKALIAEKCKVVQTPVEKAENREILSNGLSDMRLQFLSLGGKLANETTSMIMFGSFMMLADTYSIVEPPKYFMDFFKYIHGEISNDDFIDILNEKESHLKGFF